MFKIARTRVATITLLLTLPLAATPVAAAETPISTTVESASTINEQKLAQYFSEIDNAKTDEEAYGALVKLLGKDAANQAIAENSATTPSVSFRGAGTFLSCIKGKASDDIKGVLDINGVAVLIGEKNYPEAAREAVKHLAKQGIKRNAAVLAAMFAYWGWQCRGDW
ncbi:hypothetical protein [Corynebacterium anserum]|uniref:Uncharacterized protein n=1 Tax=Corynebacterium anserum TaxID=2684406 RepID=A0A7G7YQI7_9CORY|nr:hypothetical protein [Corynebacterium anserum]MBC2682447.1 hypothetical protein [Corynebacterium anserum]QNH96757.1 hypothetical protein GP473_08950 [Corynebacterium anserum]